MFFGYPVTINPKDYPVIALVQSFWKLMQQGMEIIIMINDKKDSLFREKLSNKSFFSFFHIPNATHCNTRNKYSLKKITILLFRVDVAETSDFMHLC